MSAIFHAAAACRFYQIYRALSTPCRAAFPVKEGLNMAFHPSTFEYLKPTDEQVAVMAEARTLFAETARRIDQLLPDGPDKTFMLRQLRDCAMWANIAITRNPDGSPRA